ARPQLPTNDGELVADAQSLLSQVHAPAAEQVAGLHDLSMFARPVHHERGGGLRKQLHHDETADAIAVPQQMILAQVGYYYHLMVIDGHDAVDESHGRLVGEARDDPAQ